MNKFFNAVINRKKTVILIFIIFSILCGFLMLGVGQNYDMSKYLPDDSPSKKGVDILKSEYSYNGNAVIMLQGVNIVEVLEKKQQIEKIDGIKNVVWLDDIADLKQPIELIDEEIRNNYLVGDSALLQIIFEQDDYAEQTRRAIDNLRKMFGNDLIISGSASDEYYNTKSVNETIFTGIIIALVIILLILFLATNSFFEVALFLITIGAAILLNMGTNVIFGEVSYMTFASASILQLAISMDYSIFLLHRFEQERKTEKDAGKAMIKAIKASFSSVLSSGLTTIVGFISLVFMSYTMGQDMGFVLAKGIFFSLISVMILLPALSVAFVKAIDKTKHKKLMPSMKKVQHILGGKIKYIVLGLLLILSVVSFLAQSNNKFTYASNTGSSEEQNSMNQKIEDTFGSSNNIVVLVPRGDEAGEYSNVNAIDSLAFVKSVQGYYSFIDPAMPEEMIPENIKTEFLSDNYSRYIAEIDTSIEGDDAFFAVEQIRQTVEKTYDDAFVTGASPVIYDIKQATSGDFLLVSLISILLVGLILLLTFKSVSIPIILLFIIQTSIWINMSIPYFMGTPMVFIGYMIISAVQLGATIDYTIIMTNYYLEGRKTLGKREAGEYAAEKAGASILISALVLTAAGFVVSATFSLPAMSQLGTLIGRGALLSGAMTIIVLPQVLILLDKFIKKTTMTRKLFLGRRKNEI